MAAAAGSLRFLLVAFVDSRSSRSSVSTNHEDAGNESPCPGKLIRFGLAFRLGRSFAITDSST
jgi:hypothetical protein